MTITEAMVAVLLPYGFLLEDNQEAKFAESEFVLLPYGFLLEDNGFKGWQYK